MHAEVQAELDKLRRKIKEIETAIDKWKVCLYTKHYHRQIQQFLGNEVVTELGMTMYILIISSLKAYVVFCNIDLLSIVHY